MKKFLLILMPILILVCSLMLSSSHLSKLFDCEGIDAEVNKDFENITNSSLNLGFVLEEFSCDNVKTYKQDGVVVGECVCLKGNIEDLNNICDKLGLIIVKKYNVGNINMIEGVSSRVKYFIDGRRENIQIAIEENNIMIGSPIIYGSY